MKLISAEFGQVLQLFAWEELRPLEGLFLPDLFTAIGERYNFQVRPPAPTGGDVGQGTGAKFENGRIIIKDLKIAVGQISLYSDGIIVVSSRTEDSAVVLDDFFEWTTKAFALRSLLTVKPRQYASSVVVEYPSGVDHMLAPPSPLEAHFAEAISELYDFHVPVSLSRVTLAMDPAQLPHQRLAEISIERRVGFPYAQNRFFAKANLPTETLLRLLRQLEED